jgi:O-methyltransferase involved in polyketide biosynthesis
MTDGVSDTLYIPLAARIYSTERFPDYFRDDAALGLRDRVPGDIVKGSSEYTFLASVARYRNSDAMERDFVRRNGRSSIVHLGVGLETAYLRLSDLDAHFYDMDLPEVIGMRRDLLPRSDRETLIAGDLFDMGWTERVDRSLPVMIVVLGVFQYFHEEQVIDAVQRMREAFPGAELVFDATTTDGLRYAARYVRKTGNASAAMYFAVDDAREFCGRTGTEYLECRPFFTEARAMLGRRVGLYTMIAMRVVDRDMRAKMIRLRLRRRGRCSFSLPRVGRRSDGKGMRACQDTFHSPDPTGRSHASLIPRQWRTLSDTPD